MRAFFFAHGLTFNFFEKEKSVKVLDCLFRGRGEFLEFLRFTEYFFWKREGKYDEYTT